MTCCMHILVENCGVYNMEYNSYLKIYLKKKKIFKSFFPLFIKHVKVAHWHAPLE